MVDVLVCTPRVHIQCALRKREMGSACAVMLVWICAFEHYLCAHVYVCLCNVKAWFVCPPQGGYNWPVLLVFCRSSDSLNIVLKCLVWSGLFKGNWRAFQPQYHCRNVVRQSNHRSSVSSFISFIHFTRTAFVLLPCNSLHFTFPLAFISFF